MQLGLDRKRKDELITGMSSLAYSSPNNLRATSAAVPAPQVQHGEEAPEGLSQGVQLPGGQRSSFRTLLRVKSNAQEYGDLCLPGLKKKLFPVPLGGGGGGTQGPPPPVFATPGSPLAPVLLVLRKAVSSVISAPLLISWLKIF